MEVRDDTVWDGTTPFATLVPSAHGGGAVSVQLVAPVRVRAATSATRLVDALSAAGVPVLDVGDELVRDAARADGMDGCAPRARSPPERRVEPGAPSTRQPRCRRCCPGPRSAGAVSPPRARAARRLRPTD